MHGRTAHSACWVETFAMAVAHHLRGVPLQRSSDRASAQRCCYQSQTGMVLQEQSTLHTERSSGRPMKVPPSPFATQSKEPDKAKSKCCGCVVQ